MTSVAVKRIAMRCLVRNNHHNNFYCYNSNYNKLLRCSFSFSFAGPKKLDEIVKTDLLDQKTGTEIADIWYTYHEQQDNVHGIVLKGEDKKSLDRAGDCPFFVQPIFRDDGYFMMVSQFMKPSHFCCAYLEDYKMDPSAAQPLLTFSIFDDYSEEKDITLVRCDILNKGITDDEGYKVVQNLLDSYVKDEEYLTTVHTFNNRPDAFDINDFVSRQNVKWNNNNDDNDATSSSTTTTTTSRKTNTTTTTPNA